MPEETVHPMKSSAYDAPEIKVNAARKLARQVERSEMQMSRYRIMADVMLRKWCGPHYNSSGYKGAGYTGTNRQGVARSEPLNTIATIAGIILPNLVGTDVRCKITAKKQGLTSFAKKFELRINQVLKEMRFGHTMLDGCISALFGAGFFKTIIEAQPFNHDFENWLQDPGMPFVDTIHVDDWVFDPDCKKLSAASWQGHGFMVNYEDALESETYDADELGRARNNYLDMLGRLRASEISKGHPHYGDEYTDYVRMIEIYMARENMIVTLPGVPSQTTKFLDEKEHDGPEGGPYNELGFHRPPENPLPVPPMNHLSDLHDVINSLVRKIKRDAEEAKTFVAASQAGGYKDADAVRRVRHGEMVSVADVNQLKEITIGNSDRATYDALAQVRELQNWAAGNPEAIGGLKADAKTLGQDEMQLMQANIRLYSMQKETLTVEKRIIEKIAWHIWEDRTSDSELELLLPSGGRVRLNWEATHRDGEFRDYPLDIEPYIAQSDNPIQQYRRTMELIRNAIVPLAPYMAEQGVTINVQGLIQSLGEKLDLHDMHRWFSVAELELGQNTGQVRPPQGGLGEGGGSRSPGGRVSGPPMNAAASQMGPEPAQPGTASQQSAPIGAGV